MRLGVGVGVGVRVRVVRGRDAPTLEVRGRVRGSG